MDKLKIRTEDSPISEYVQHPIPIPAPWDKNAVPLKPLKLTKEVCVRDEKDVISIPEASYLLGNEKNSSQPSEGRVARQARPYSYGSHSPRSS